MSQALTPGTAPFLEALANLLDMHGNEKMNTLPEDDEILTRSIVDSPFEWIGFALFELDAGPAGTCVSDVIEAMGINAFTCHRSGRLIEGHNAQLGFALGIGSERKGATMTGIQVAQTVRNVINVIPHTH